MTTLRVLSVMPTAGRRYSVSRSLGLLLCIVGFAGACGDARTPRSDTMSGGGSQSASSDAPSSGEGWIYTADEIGRSVTRVDLGSGVATTIPVGISPHNVQVAPDGRTVLLVGSAAMDMSEQATGQQGHGADMPGTLLMLAADARDTSGAVRVPVSSDPAHAVTSPDGRLAFVTSSGQDAVIVVDLGTRRVVDTIPTGAYPHGLRLSPDGRELYVATVTANAVSVIDIAEAREVARIPVGRAPVQVGFLPDGGRAYVTLRDENAVASIDTRTRRVVARVRVGNAPIQLMATPDGRYVYVANQGTKARPDSTVSVIAADRDSVVATIPAGRGAHGVAVSADGRRVYIANTFGNSVTEIDVAAQRALRTIPVGQGPGGISFRPSGSR